MYRVVNSMKPNKKLKTYGKMAVWYFIDVLLASIFFGLWQENFYAGLFILEVGVCICCICAEVFQ